MTRLMQKVDSAATKGARKESISARSSMLRTSTDKSSSSKGHITISHGKREAEIKVDRPNSR
jgi:hypothetical protein